MQRGFSLIELLVVVAILAMLVGFAAPYYAEYVKESKISKAKADLETLKRAVILYNSREDIPYQGPIASSPPYLPYLGENDFIGLQGQYLTSIPLDPWGRNYKLDPYACLVYSEGPDPRNSGDDIRDYYINELAMRKIEWEDTNNDRKLSAGDLIYIHFNKSLYVSGLQSTDFEVYENNQIIATISFPILYNAAHMPVGYSDTIATTSTIICEVQDNANSAVVGIHYIALQDDLEILRKYREVIYDRKYSDAFTIQTKVEMNHLGQPSRYAIRTHPIKITPKH